MPPPDDGSPAGPKPADPPAPIFHRPDHALYAEARSLCQRAGVREEDLVALVAKELIDNALDQTDATGADPFDVDLAIKPNPSGLGGLIRVADRAGGMQGDAAEIASLFSLARPLASSKLLPAPTRGAIGNGLRVAVGLVVCAAGTIIVRTRRMRLVLKPEIDLTRIVEHQDHLEDLEGTEIDLVLPGRFAVRAEDNRLAKPGLDAALVAGGPAWRRAPSLHWIDADRWLTILRAAPAALTARQMIARFDGLSSNEKSGGLTQHIVSRACRSLSRAEALALLADAREAARPPRAAAFAPIGAGYSDEAQGYAAVNEIDRDGRPLLVEAWAIVEDRRRPASHAATLLINRTATPSQEVQVAPAAGRMALFGFGLATYLEGVAPGGYSVTIAITAPVVPLVSDGKAPDLKAWCAPIAKAAASAIRRARKEIADPDAPTISAKEAILSLLDDAIADASDGGTLRFNQRNLYYRVRDEVARMSGAPLRYAYFTSVITDYEAENGDIPGMWRNARGSYVLPHNEGAQVALGTMEVERFVRPEWRFANVLVCEKEDTLPILAAAGFADRWDCLLVSSSGMTTRALRDLIDRIGETQHGEPVRIFCIHDADAAGGIIAETLVRETRARGARNIEVTDLGLFPWTAFDAGLAVEEFPRAPRRQPTAAIIKERDEALGDGWDEWLQTHRIELNAMTSRQMIEWLDQQFVAHGARRIDPPDEILADAFDARVREQIEKQETDRELARLRPIIAARVADRLAAIAAPSPDSLRRIVEDTQAVEPGVLWRAAIDEAADAAAEDGSPEAG